MRVHQGVRVYVLVGNAATTTAYLGGVYEEDLQTGTKRLHYTFNGQVVAQRTLTSSSNELRYLYADHLGSISVASNEGGTSYTKQDFTPWGEVRSGGISATTLNYTGQRRDSTGLLYYHARYYDPTTARFLSADSVVPGAADGSMDGVALKPLTVDFHEPGFVAGVNAENKLALPFQDREQVKPWGPTNAQALNRYSYVQNNPLKYTDPSGHVYCASCDSKAGGGGAVGAAIVGGSAVVAGGYAGYQAGKAAAGAAVGHEAGKAVVHQYNWETRETSYGRNKTVKVRPLSDREVKDHGLHRGKSKQKYGAADSYYADEQGNLYLGGAQGELSPTGDNINDDEGRSKSKGKGRR